MSGTAAAGDVVVDTHLHLWDLETGDYGWNTPALGSAHATHDAAQARRELESSIVEAAVLVQAADTAGDTERLLDVVRDEPWAVGVVAWAPLEDAARAEELLGTWAGRGVVGVRQLVHDDPRSDLLASPPVRRTGRLLGRFGLPLDVPDAWPRLWPALTALVDAVPDALVVLDHLGAPGPRAPGDTTWFVDWRRDLDDLARRPNVVAKISALKGAPSPGGSPVARSVRPVVEVALSAFGPARLMLGSDWPLSTSPDGYARTTSRLDAALVGLSTDERTQVRSGTANRTYGLELRPATAAASPQRR